MTPEQSTSAAPLVRLGQASVTRDGVRLLDCMDFSLEPGARWAVLGQNGAGKTTLLRLLRGDIIPDLGGERRYCLPGQDGPQDTPLGLRQRLALVSGDMQDQYARHEWPITGLEAVLTGFSDTALLYAEPTPEQRSAGQATLKALGLEHLARRRVARMSSGQARAILLARALACKPAALFLDECLEGLDAPARREFLAALDRAAKADPALALLFCSHRTDELPACLDLGLVMEAGRIRARGPLAGMLGVAAQGGPAPQAVLVHPAAPLRAQGKDSPERVQRPAPQIAAPTEEDKEGSQPQQAPAALAAALGFAPPSVCRDFLARISRADLVIDGTQLLHGICWTILPGEHWAVLGPNGAGKSTLLSLLAGDCWPSAVDGPPGLVEYGFARPGETLDEARRRLGRVSAALDSGYSWDLKAQEVVWSGTLGSIGLYGEADAAAQGRSARLLEFFGLGGLAARRLRSLSRGQLRRVMLARALAGNPALLLLDEPMAGLDARARKAARELLSRLALAGVPIVMVTHHLRDLPEQVNRVLVLEEGRVVFSGRRAEHEGWQADRAGRTANQTRKV